jgi:galactose oxidase
MQDGVANGRIGKYEVYVSADGASWPAEPIAAGTFADSAAAKTVTFTAKTGAAVRLTALTEAGNRGPWSAGAEVNVIGVRNGNTGTPPPPPTGNVLIRKNWIASATSSEAGTHPPSAAIDPSVDTFWHSKYGGGSDPLPHSLTVDFGGVTNEVNALIYTPRPANTGANGRIGKYEACTRRAAAARRLSVPQKP